MLYPAKHALRENMSNKRTAALALILAAALLATGGLLFLMNPGEDERASGNLPVFKNYQQMSSFIQRSHDKGIWNVLAAEGDSATAGQGARHSTTNVQVEGVDEADSVKTDGELLYIASYDTISIIRAYPAEGMANQSNLDMRQALGLGDNYSVWIQGIYVHEDRLIAIVSVSGPYDYYGYPGNGSSGSEDGKEIMPMPAIWRMPEERSMVAVFSLSQTDPPSLIGTEGVSGYSITTRMTGDVVYLVAQHYIWLYANEVSLPEVWDEEGASRMAVSDVHYDPDCNDPASFLNLLAIDVSTMESNCASILTGYASTIYVSTQAMYLTFQKWTGSGGMDQVAQSSSLSIAASVAVSSDATSTTIYKISLDGLSMVPMARGDVPGYLLNQFSLDESEGLLRVATTFSWENQRSAVYVLDQDLVVIGALEDLAPGERIFSCRFMGDTLYMVTFRQVDPLFVIDLSDPTSPAVLGQLKVPGFSSYLHPVGDGRLVGIGMENGSVKVSLFDVSYPHQPVELDTVQVPGWSSSEALWDHKAVTYDEWTGSLVIPVTSWDMYSYNCTSGSNVFVIKNDGVELKGVVEPEYGEYTMRAQYIGEVLYTITDTSVYANSLLDLSPIGKLVYRERYYNFLPYLMGAGDVVAIAEAR